MKPTFFTLLALAIAPLTIPDANAQTAPSSPAVRTFPMSPNDVTPLKIGLKLPQITLRDSKGAAYDVSKSLAESPAILVFYRGGWCPYCNSQLAELGKIESQLLKMGYRIFAISPDTPSELSKTGAKHNLPYKLLSDSNLMAARSLGLAFLLDDETVRKYKEYGIDLLKSSGGESRNMLPVPAVYLVGKDGIVDFSYVNPDYKTRVPGDLILAAAKIYAPKK